MKWSRSFVATAVVVALVVAGVSVAAGWRVIRGDGRLLRGVSVDHDRITPNADRDTDVTTIRYEITSNAQVSVYFVDAEGQRFYFRQARRRGAGRYQVQFSGVVAGYHRPGETLEGEIVARLLADGTYTWVVEATANGAQERVSGTLVIQDAATDLPEMRDFSLDRPVFSPNQDGIDDRVLIQYFLTKPATVRVYLQQPDGVLVTIPEKDLGVRPGDRGWHAYDYEGGVDNKATPPPDGTYPIVALAEDAAGQKVRVEGRLTIAFGGVPLANIVSPPVGDTVQFNATSIALCDTLYFTVTVENYGATPIRTTGPTPGVVYDSTWNYNTLGWHTESGAWRLALGYENELFNYPFRWALGDSDSLTEIEGHLYLMPGDRAVVTGGVRLTDLLGERNPQPMWAGLIHEDVEIAQVNNRVDQKAVLIDVPDPANRQPCREREIPRRREVAGGP